ncbi:hAT family dimerization protein, partial [Rhizoctonia solani AG-3 Rhs1AP]
MLVKYYFRSLMIWGLLRRQIGQITADNASNNNTMMQELKRMFDSRGINFDPEENRLRCFPHIINIATQAYLHALPKSAEKFREKCAEKVVELSAEQSSYLSALASDAVAACRDTVKSCLSSGIRREGFKRNLIEGNKAGRFKLNGKTVILPIILPSLDCPTRWASTADMVDNFRLLYIAVLDYSIRNTDLDIPCLGHKQFAVLQDVSSFLSVARRVQQLLSSERTPTLALALPLYENLIVIWKTCLKKFPEHDHAISLAIGKIEEYIGKSRTSPIHAFAMFVNPHIKMNWINTHWIESKIERALDAVKARLLLYAEERHRKKLEQCNQIRQTKASAADWAAMSQQRGYAELLLLGDSIDCVPDHPLSHVLVDSRTTSEACPDPASNRLLLPAESRHPGSDSEEPASEPSFGLESELSYATLTAQLSPEQLKARLLTETDPSNPMKKENVNIVDFWKSNNDVLPLIHRMAVDVLPAQASSVSSERVFSSSKLTCTRERNRISSELVEALQVVKHSDFSERIAPLGDDIVE